MADGPIDTGFQDFTFEVGVADRERFKEYAQWEGEMTDEHIRVLCEDLADKMALGLTMRLSRIGRKPERGFGRAGCRSGATVSVRIPRDAVGEDTKRMILNPASDTGLEIKEIVGG